MFVSVLGPCFSNVPLLDVAVKYALHVFFNIHLLHWIECLSVLGELQAAIKILGLAEAALLVSCLPG